MQTTEQKTMPAAAHNLTAIQNGLPFEVEQAWICSESYIRNYLRTDALLRLKSTRMPWGHSGKPVARKDS